MAIGAMPEPPLSIGPEGGSPGGGGGVSSDKGHALRLSQYQGVRYHAHAPEANAPFHDAAHLLTSTGLARQAGLCQTAATPFQDIPHHGHSRRQSADL
jgi:hypothetical protein